MKRIFVLFTVGISTLVQAATIYVTPTGSDPVGASWASPSSLANALTIGTSNDAIWLAEGDYAVTTPLTVASNGISLYGGFTNGMATFAERDWTAYPAILNGQGTAIGMLSVTAADVTLDGLVISNSVSGVDNYGAGKAAVDKRVAGSLTVANCRIVNHSNGGRNYGALGAYLTAGQVRMTNCVFANITKTYRDAAAVAVVSQGADLELVDCVFTNNSGLGLDGIKGTSLFFNKGTLVALRTQFLDDQLGKRVSGGAVYLGNDSTTRASFSNCVFRGNQGAYPGYGGAMWVQLAAAVTAKVVNCTFTDNGRNDILGFGGAIYLSSGTLDIRNSILWSNRVASATPNNGHEIYVEGGVCRVKSSLLTGVGLPYIYGVSDAIVIDDCMSGRDPLFAGPADLHVQSAAGRWDPVSSAFIFSDTAYSPAIDAGDPDDPVGGEASPNGGRINLGAYGGTPQASKSPAAVSPLLGDLGARVHYDAAEISGELTNAAYASAQVYLCYGASNPGGGDTTNGWDAVVSVGKQDTGAFFSAWTGPLATNVLYYYRWYAVNGEGAGWTPAATFTTLSASAGGGATVIHVDRTATSGARDGRDWANACLDVSSASLAVSGTRTNLWVTGDRYAEGGIVSLPVYTIMVGGFEGGETAVSQRSLTNALGTVTNYTVLDGQGQWRCVVRVTGADVTVEAVAITNSIGGADQYGTYNSGLTKLVSGALTLSNCRFVDNPSATRYERGIGAYFKAGTVLMTNCLVANNSHVGRADWPGAIYADGASLTVVDCLFTNNNYRNGTFVKGTALAVNAGALRVTRTEFSENPGSDGGGGAVYVANGAGTSAVFSNCLFRANQTATAGKGGAIWIELPAAGTATVVNCTFADNTRTHSGGYGGAIYLNSGTLVLKNSIFWTNVVAGVANGHDLYATNASSRVRASYSSFSDTNSPYVEALGGAAVEWGEGILTGDPLFAGDKDLHLKSKGGRWDTALSDWVVDSETSPCLDAGDPAEPVGMEPMPNGGTINLGVYGGTWQASKTWRAPGSLIMVR